MRLLCTPRDAAHDRLIDCLQSAAGVAFKQGGEFIGEQQQEKINIVAVGEPLLDNAVVVMREERAAVFVGEHEFGHELRR